MWAQLINVCIGLWLIVSPAVLNMPDRWATNEHVVGPIVTTIALVAVSESTRNLRYGNVLTGLWLLAAPWVLHHDAGWVIVSEMGAGALLTGLSLVRGRVVHRFGGGWRALTRQKPDHWRAANLQEENF